jgi:hypothetical protein
MFKDNLGPGIAARVVSLAIGAHFPLSCWPGICEPAGLSTPRCVAFQQIDAAAGQPLGQRHADMASAAGGAALVESEDDRAVGHVPHMPHRAVVERGDFHHVTFREKKEGRGGTRRHRPCRKKHKQPSGLQSRSAMAPTRSLAGPYRACVEFPRPLPPHLPVIEKGPPMLSLTMPIVMRFVLAAAVTLPTAAYAADATHTDAATKDACIKACNECLRACRECILGCDCPGCEKTCLTCIETCRACVALMEYDSAMAEEMCEVCEEACEQCAAECTKCGDELCCKTCAAACKKCHDACRAMRH